MLFAISLPAGLPSCKVTHPEDTATLTGIRDSL